jgi:hypothetical protein
MWVCNSAVGSATEAVRVCDINSKSIEGEVSGVHAREAKISVPIIPESSMTEIEPYTEHPSTLEQHSYDPSLTCFDSLLCSLQLHDRDIVASLPALQLFQSSRLFLVWKLALSWLSWRNCRECSHVATIVGGDTPSPTLIVVGPR